ncbi:MAG: NagC family transcriptional regulator, partial [Desulfurococcaceae archaeon]
SPQVIVLKAHGQLVYQVIGSEVREEPLTTPVTEHAPPLSEDDIKFVMDQTGASRDKAVEALVKAKGDIARAIMILRGEVE